MLRTMRIALVAALLVLSACAAERLAPAPPAGVDFSGRWILNAADSDDPLHLLQSENAAAAGSASGQRGQGGQGGRGGRAGAGFGGPGAGGAPMPPFAELADGLKWPAKEVETRQSGAVVTILSAGISQECRPGAGPEGRERHHRPPDEPASRDMPSRERGEGPPPLCGWDGKTLVVQTRDSEDETPPYTQRYSLSEDGRRLIEVVDFRGGRSGGFSVSRVWDRRAPDAATPSGGGEPRR